MRPGSVSWETSNRLRAASAATGDPKSTWRRPPTQRCILSHPLTWVKLRGGTHRTPRSLSWSSYRFNLLQPLQNLTLPRLASPPPNLLLNLNNKPSTSKPPSLTVPGNDALYSLAFQTAGLLPCAPLSDLHLSCYFVLEVTFSWPLCITIALWPSSGVCSGLFLTVTSPEVNGQRSLGLHIQGFFFLFFFFLVLYSGGGIDD